MKTNRTILIRTAALAAAAALLAGCGNAPTAKAGPKLTLGARSGAADAGKVAGSSAMSIAWARYHYVLADGEYPLGGTRPGFVVRPVLPTQDQLAALAAAAGFDIGTLTSSSGAWQTMTGSQNLWADSHGWSLYDNSAMYPMLSCGTLEVDSAGGQTAAPVDVPCPNDEIPTVDTDAADSVATAIFAAGGAGEGTVDGFEQDGIYTVTHTETIDGVPTDRIWTVTFIGNDVAYANGTFSTLEEIGTYDTIDAKAAALRLDDMQWAAPTWKNAIASGAPAIDSIAVAEGKTLVTVTGEAPLDDQPVSQPSGPDDAQVSTGEPLPPYLTPLCGTTGTIDPGLTPEPVPTDGTIEPEVVTITLDTVDAAYVTWWGGDDSYVLPAYKMSNDTTAVNVLAVEDDAVSFEDPTSIYEPGTIDPGLTPEPLPAGFPTTGAGTVGSTGVDGNVSGGSGATGESGSANGSYTGSGTIDPDQSGTAVTPETPAAVDPDLSCLIGMTETDAQKLLGDAGYTLRVTERDGEGYMMTDDYRTDRVNVIITDGHVTAALIG